MIEEVLNQRQTTHGSFTKNAETAQMLKYFVKQGDNYNDMPVVQREALDMILHKIARIVNGDPNYIDNWIDICGYSQLVIEEVKSYEEPT